MSISDTSNSQHKNMVKSMIWIAEITQNYQRNSSNLNNENSCADFPLLRLLKAHMSFIKISPKMQPDWRQFRNIFSTSCGETTYFRDAARLMKGEDAKNVPKQSISDQFLKNTRRPWNLHRARSISFWSWQKNPPHITHLFHGLQIVFFFDSVEYVLQRYVFKGT